MEGKILDNAEVLDFTGYPLEAEKTITLHTDLTDVLDRDPPVLFRIYAVVIGCERITLYGKVSCGSEEENAKVLLDGDCLLKKDDGNPVGLLEILGEVRAGVVNCGCVYHAEERVPCVHDFAMATNKQ